MTPIAVTYNALGLQSGSSVILAKLENLLTIIIPRPPWPGVVTPGRIPAWIK